MSPKKVSVEVEGRDLNLSNLDKNLYPEFTKGEVIDYYAKAAPVMLAHLKGRPATRKRYPDGVDAQSFFEKNAPSHTPDWVRTVTVPTPGSSTGRESSTSSWWTTCRRWCGWPTSRRWNCTSRSGRSGRAARSTAPT
ncbi:hypothetical protein ACFQHO_30810 [Actinomadura yumaensis]|uniref:non-homologous end-joining DNA ligase LigD n=1 Tax=Actinomadura yumaensis TaxID=111807 RepID=UPI00360DCA2A